eukprot:8409230-Lingulodinium_polyedra.AAC.1
MPSRPRFFTSSIVNGRGPRPTRRRKKVNDPLRKYHNCPAGPRRVAVWKTIARAALELPGAAGATTAGS